MTTTIGHEEESQGDRISHSAYIPTSTFELKVARGIEPEARAGLPPIYMHKHYVANI